MEVSCNAFLGGKLMLRQPVQGYRAGIDPVLLAAACEVRPGARVLELGCGVGTALFCLARRVPNLVLWGVERDPDIAELARQNARDNGIEAQILTADLAALPGDMRQRQFDLTLANPPFFDRCHSTPSDNVGREGGRGEVTGLDIWIDTATRRLAPKGKLVVIQRMERLPALLAAVERGLGSIEVIPVQPRVDRPARLFLMRAQKNGGAAFRLTPPLVLHEGPKHLDDGDDYRADISAVLREGWALPVPGAG